MRQTVCPSILGLTGRKMVETLVEICNRPTPRGIEDCSGKPADYDGCS